MIVMARNPIDVIPSFCNLVNTQSHSLEINEKMHEDHPQSWWVWVNKMTANMKKNHEEVYEDIAKNIPTYFMRYEDLKLNPVPVLEELFCFLLDTPSIEGTLVQRRIQEVASKGYAGQTAYKLKASTNSTGLCKYQHMYNAYQLEIMQRELKEMIMFWDYGQGMTDQSHDVYTNFFDVP